MSTLPAEVSSLTQLERVDISHNSFVSLPECLFQAPKLTEIDARKNFIAGGSTPQIPTWTGKTSLTLKCIFLSKRLPETRAGCQTQRQIHASS